MTLPNHSYIPLYVISRAFAAYISSFRWRSYKSKTQIDRTRGRRKKEEEDMSAHPPHHDRDGSCEPGMDDVNSAIGPQSKRPLLNGEDDDGQGSRTPVTATTTSSRSRSAKGKEKIEGQDGSFASKMSGVEEEGEDDGITTISGVLWSLFANKNSIPVLGDWDGEDSGDVHGDNDDF
ncbi:hypothetical protein BGX27_002900 [Mortierella sp. AM989]|nr:hypothetical protein BGX27_002900 [Mortierella sp. AM989]